MRQRTRRNIHNLLWAVSIVLVSALIMTVLGIWSLARGYARLSTVLFQVVRPVTWALSRVTGRSVSSLEVWDEGVWLGNTTGQLWLKAQADKDRSFQDRVAMATQALPQITTHNRHFTQHFAQSWLLSQLVKQHTQLAESLTVAQAVLETINTSVVNNARYLVVLQNTDEVRATGGFMGSYTVLDFGAQDFLAVDVRDIYDPSGVTISLPSPPGQQEYLSEGKGMKLVDANWNPDFPATAEVILGYFSQIRGDSQQYDGVIAVPLSVVEKLLAAVDGIYVADLHQTVTAEMFADAARQDRESFFSGSQNKTQSLKSFYTALVLRLSELSLAEWTRVVQSLVHDQSLQEIQLFAKDPAIQEPIEAAGLDGALEAYGPDQFFLFPVESNVGINKANRKVTRSLTADYEPGTLDLAVKFHDAYTFLDRPAPIENAAYTRAPHLSYVNYYRLLTSPNLKVIRIMVNGKPTQSLDEAMIVGSNGLPYVQLGFLAVVPEDTTVEVIAYFTAPEISLPKIIVQKQIGIEYNSVVFSCFSNLLHSPLYMIRKGLIYQDTCGEQVQ